MQVKREIYIFIGAGCQQQNLPPVLLAPTLTLLKYTSLSHYTANA